LVSYTTQRSNTPIPAEVFDLDHRMGGQRRTPRPTAPSPPGPPP